MKRFVAKISPAKVVQVRSVMEHVNGADGERLPSSGAAIEIKRHETINEISPLPMQTDAALPVTDDTGNLVGKLDPLRALRVLTRAET